MKLITVNLENRLICYESFVLIPWMFRCYNTGVVACNMDVARFIGWRLMNGRETKFCQLYHEQITSLLCNQQYMIIWGIELFVTTEHIIETSRKIIWIIRTEIPFLNLIVSTISYLPLRSKGNLSMTSISLINYHSTTWTQS